MTEAEARALLESADLFQGAEPSVVFESSGQIHASWTLSTTFEEVGELLRDCDATAKSLGGHANAYVPNGQPRITVIVLARALREWAREAA